MREEDFPYEQNFFAEFPELEKIFIKEAKKYMYRKGSTIFHESSPGDECYYIASGEIHKYCTGENGKDALLSIYYKGTIFGLSDIFAGYKRDCRTVTMKSTTLYGVKKEKLLPLLCNSNFNLKLLSLICRHKVYAERRLAYMILYNTPERFVHLLVLFYKIMLETSTSISNSKKPIPICLSQSLLAAMIGSTQATISGLLRELHQEELLDKGIKHIIVPDPAALWEKVFRQSFDDIWTQSE